MSRRIFAISSVLGLLLLVALIASSRQVFALTPTPLQPTSTAIPGADFVGTPLSGNAPLTVQFTALNTSILISCSWTFGDGTGQSFTPPAGSNFATCPSVAHTYTNPGAYAVSLSVTKATGMSNSMIKAQYIQVAGLTPTAVSTNNGVPLPDLTISTINYVGSTPACTNNPRDAVTIINGGTAAAGTFVVSFASQTQTVSGLGAGQTITLSFAVGVPTTATVDSTNMITESNESNNSFTASLPAPTQAPTCTPTSGPSLTPTRTPTPGCDTLTITGEVYDAAIGTSQGISGATVTAGLSVPRTFSTTTGAGGMYTLVVPTGYGCSVTLLSVQASGYQSVSRTINSSQLVAQPQQNFGLISLVSATPTRTPTTGPSLTPTRTPTTGPSLTPTHEVNMCTPTSTIAAPFTFDGAGTFCWQASALGSYINSWNTTSVTLNGVNVSNLYVGSGSYPAKINGSYYVAYNSSVAWGHFETK